MKALGLPPAHPAASDIGNVLRAHSHHVKPNEPCSERAEVLFLARLKSLGVGCRSFKWAIMIRGRQDPINSEGKIAFAD